MKNIICLPFLILITFHAKGQIPDHFVAVDSPSGKQRFRVHKGQTIDLKLKSGKRYQQTLIDLLDSSLVLSDDTIQLNSIRKVYFKNLHYGLGLLSAVCLRAGLGYFAIDTGNRLINQDDPRLNPTTLNVSLGIVTVGLISKALNRNTITIKNPNQIKIIDL